MRRMLLAGLAVTLCGALALIAVTSLGSSAREAGSGTPDAAAAPAAPESGPFALAAERTSDGRGDGFYEAAADRHRAAEAARRVQRPGLMRRRDGLLGERVVAQLTRDLADRLDVDEERLRSALASVGRDTLSRPIRSDRRRWPLLKHEAIDEVARKIDRPPGDVASAARNELELKLRRGVTFGTVSTRGRALALACFDAPQTCDVPALRREVRGRR